MKLRTTKREVRENAYRILSVGYCEIQFLMRSKEPFSYCAGVYGWCCDNYEITTNKYRLVISTGYSPINDKNICKETLKNKYNIIKKYEDKARKINSTSKGWDDVKKKLDKLVNKFVDEICEEEI